MLGQQVAIVAGSLVDGAVLPRLSEGGQRLYHQPCRIVGIFNGQFLLVGTLWEQLGEVDSLHTSLMLCDRHCLGNIFLISKDGQIVLLAIRETVALSHHFADEEGNVER